MAYGILHSREDAEECVNDAYLAVWNSIPPEAPNPLVTFVCKIVRNIALNKYKYNTAQKRNSHYDVCLDELEECVPSGENPEAQLDRTLLKEYINGFLGSLDEKNRVIFVRRYWFADDFKAIARLVGLGEGAVRTRLSRLRTRLKEYLTEKGVSI